MKKNKGQFCTA